MPHADRTAVIMEFQAKYGDTVLPVICLDIRQSCNGASDPWADKPLEDACQYLEQRLALWHEPSDAIDNHVRGICQQAIWIARSELMRRIVEDCHIKGECQ